MAPRTEPELRIAVLNWLEEQGIVVAERVICVAGEPDIVAADHSVLYELKLHLTRKSVYSGVGQLLIYRQCLNPLARLVLIGLPTPDIYALQLIVEALGIEVVIWDNESKPGGQSLTLESKNLLPSTPSHTPPARLNWNIRTLAESRGITTVAALARATGISRQSLYPIWNNQSENTAVETLARLARTLKANVGAWFRWEGNQLVWNIATVAEQQGLSKAQVAFAAELYPRTADLYFNDAAQFVFRTTLAKLAPALQLDVGDLFAWQIS